MKKQIITIALTALLTIIIVLGVLYGFQVLPEGRAFDFGTLGVYLGAIGSVGAIFIVWWTTKKQIENQNREANRPYLILQSVEEVHGKDYIYEIEFSNYKKVKELGKYSGYMRRETLIQFNFLNYGKGIANIKSLRYIEGKTECNFLGSYEQNGIETNTIKAIQPYSGIHLSFISIYSLYEISDDYCLLEVFYTDIYNNEYNLKLRISISEELGNSKIQYNIIQN